MTVLHPCLHCHRNANCEIKTRILKSIRGLGLSLARVRCTIPESDFPAGTPVKVEAFEIVPSDSVWDDGSDFRKVAITRTGVVRRWHKKMASITLDIGQEITQPYRTAIGIIGVPSDRLTKISDPVAVCDCGFTLERCQNEQYPPIPNDGKWFCGTRERERGGY